MIEYRCGCGKSIYWSSGYPPKPCDGCPECGTNFMRETLHPHQYEDYYLGGKEPNKVQRCKECGYIERKPREQAQRQEN